MKELKDGRILLSMRPSGNEEIRAWVLKIISILKTKSITNLLLPFCREHKYVLGQEKITKGVDNKNVISVHR